MNALTRWIKRQRIDPELAEEMEEHLRERAAALMESGLSEKDARDQARRQFGNVTALEEQSREEWGWNGAEQTIGDLRLALRTLAKTPAFAITAIAILALGIGLNTAMFSVVKAVLLAQLPYPEPERLVQVWQTNKQGGNMSVSGLDYRDWRDQNRSIEHLSSYFDNVAAISGSFPARRVRISAVSIGFFQTLGVSPAAGRIFTAREHVHGAAPLIVLGAALARSAFASEEAAIGKAVRLDGMAFTVIGVMPEGFRFSRDSDAWIALEVVTGETARSAHNFHVFGRLRPGISLHAAQADMNLIAGRLASMYADDKDRGIRVISLHDEITGPVKPAMLMLLTAVGFVLLIACVNLSNLQFARGAARAKEMALRAALGAGRIRLTRQLLTESMFLAAAGGLTGVLLAELTVALLQNAIPANIPRIGRIEVDMGVLWFTLVLSVTTGLLFGVAPAFRASRADANDALKEGVGRATAGPGQRKSGNALVVAEVAMAMVLLTGAGLLLKSYWNLERVPPGFETANIYTAELLWPTVSGDKVDGALEGGLSQQILDKVKSAPGIEAAGLISTLPMKNTGADGAFEIEGIALPTNPHDYPDAWYRLATWGYFNAMRIQLLDGRVFDKQDRSDGPQVAVVNESFARQFFPRGSAIGKRIRFLGFDLKPQFMTIVGVVADTRAFGLARPAESEVFADYFQHTDSGLAPDSVLMMRGPGAGSAAIAGMIHDVNRETPVELRSMKGVISETMARQRFNTMLLALFAGLALMLAALGIYGVLSYSVNRRTSEFGIRMALGAAKRDVLLLVIGEGAALTGLGLVLGVGVALVATRLLAGMLFGIGAWDPASFLEVAAIFASVAILACYLPARHATRIQPTEALRHE